MILLTENSISHERINALVHMVGVYEGGVGKPIRITKQRVLKVGHPESALHVPIKSSDKLCFSDYGHFVIMEGMGMIYSVYLRVWCDF